MANGSAETLTLDGSVVHGARTLIGTATIVNGVMKLLRHASDEDACLAQINFAGTIEATLKAQGEFSLEVLLIKLIQQM